MTWANGILLAAIFWLTSVAATCYNRDGTAIRNQAYQPCRNDTQYTMCCGTRHQEVGETNVENDKCVPNGLCQNHDAARGVGDTPPMLWWRQGCTDPKWESPFCLKGICDNQTSWQTDNAPVRNCTDGKWCCGDETCCTQPKKLFTLADVVGVSKSSSFVATSTTLPSSTITFTPTTTQSTPANTSVPASGISTSTKIGIGVGVAGGALGLFGIGIAFWILKRRKNTRANPYEGQSLMNNDKSFALTYAHQVAPAELRGEQGAELEGQSRVESGGTVIPAELPGSKVGGNPESPT
ncbi:hypothetical protein BCR34DRAFT_22117 [Clohesyomyces aquaticus]|uniref:Mid2 domain-containing protein n=1 Tax=Clohesyomyces aquaticus TaxID=1231657 RepID=A0A1Y2A4Z6_9PLEO|nr:hypothetical protein BCR34DRAFT_22117 [Clohesyomyces aquaticus]